MKAVITVGGKQYIVAEGDTLLVDKLPEGTKELTPDVLMTFEGDAATVGTPTVAGASVTLTVTDDLVKGEKVRVIRYKAKKRVHTENGHRQQYSRITVASIR